jgi:PrtD family type I secretion system ABC transporter
MPTSPSSWRDIRRLLQAAPVADESHTSTDRTDFPAVSRHAIVDDPHPICFADVASEIRSVLLFVALFSLIINVLMLVGPIYMMQVYDRVLTSGSIPTLIYLAIVAGLLLVCSALLEGTRSRVLVRVGGRIDELLSAELFARLVSEGPSAGSPKSSSLRDLETLRTFLTGQGLFFFLDAPWTPIFLAVTFILHPLLFIVALIGAVTLFALAVVSEFATRTPLTDAGVKLAGAGRFAADVANNADTVGAMGMMEGLRSRWLAQWRLGLLLQSVASDRAGLLSAVTKFIRPMLQIVLLGVGAALAIQQEISAGAMVAASIVMGRALAPVEGAIGNWRSFVLARDAYGRVRDVLTEPARRSSHLPLPNPEGFLSVESLFGAPPGVEKPTIRDVSFRLDEGEALGIVGASGSGKSTLARFVVGAWRPASGCARLAGVDVAGWKRSELGPHVGYLSQNIELFDGTIAENIARFHVTDAAEIVSAAKRAGVHEMILRMSNGYDTRVGFSGALLSGGQRQRIGLARALYGNPTFVVLDEPNSNLDGQGEEALLSALRDLKERGATVIVISHRLTVLEAVDKILVLRDGTVEQLGLRHDMLGKLTRGIHQQHQASHEPKVRELPAQQPANDVALRSA